MVSCVSIESINTSDSSATQSLCRPRQQQDWIQIRLKELETLVFGDKTELDFGNQSNSNSSLDHDNSTVDATVQDNSESLSEKHIPPNLTSANISQRLETLIHTVSKFEDNHVSRFFRKYNSIEPFIGSHDQLPSISPMSEDPLVQEMIILSFYNKCIVVAKKLEEIQELEKHINPSYTSELSDWCKRLDKLQTTQRLIDIEALELHRRTSKLLDTYDRIINLTSLKFLTSDSTLLQMENKMK